MLSVWRVKLWILIHWWFCSAGFEISNICHLFIFQISKWFPQFFNIIVFFNKRIHFIFNWNSGGFFRSSVVTKYMYFRFSYINLLIKLTIRSAVKSISVVGHKLRLVKKKDKYFSYRIWAFYNICIQSSS